MRKIDCIIFSCTGREHLLATTLKNLPTIANRNIFRHILSIDGPFDFGAVDLSLIDTVIWGRERAGYPRSIIRAAALLSAPFVLWIEDDWDVKSITLEHITRAADALDSDNSIFQIRWPKDHTDDNKNKYKPDLLYSIHHFSANPHISRHSYLTMILSSLANIIDNGGSDNNTLGFEEFLSLEAKNLNFTSLVFSPSATGIVNHLGYLEGTDRNFHYIGNSSTSVLGNSSIGRFSETKYNTLSIAIQFLITFSKVIITLPFSFRSIELAFKFIQASRTDRRR